MIITLCIPSYNRPLELRRLLESIARQTLKSNYEILIAEDNSPKREDVIKVVNDFKTKYDSIPLRLILNNKNLGYDGNLRNLIESANGEFCMFLGDDDVLLIDSLEKIKNVLVNYSNIGFVLRSWIEKDIQGNILTEQRYFPENKIFEPGLETIVAFYRRSVFISGLVCHTNTAKSYSTDLIDGKLLYQLYLLCNILTVKRGYYIYDDIAVRISGAEHYFGSSEVEKELYTPKKLTVENSLNFMRGFIELLDYVNIDYRESLKQKIKIDLSKYSFGFLTYQRDNGIYNFIRYSIGLMKFGYGRTFYFYFYVLMILCLGRERSLRVVKFLKSRIKNIPQL